MSFSASAANERVLRAIHGRRAERESTGWPRHHGAAGMVSAPAECHASAAPELENCGWRVRDSLARLGRRSEHRRTAAGRACAQGIDSGEAGSSQLSAVSRVSKACSGEWFFCLALKAGRQVNQDTLLPSSVVYCLRDGMTL